ncbi:hypothetical protein JW960_29425 [candidate division KSB1 bacterium]|nr:hypothetical protein [candidate division KSB1 bacterium]
MSNLILKIISFAGLLLTIIPSFMVFSQGMELNTNKYLMLLGTILWFACTPFWMNRNANN